MSSGVKLSSLARETFSVSNSKYSAIFRGESQQ